MPDQWRGMDLGSMGNTQVRTPNLDKLAREGVHFRNAVANTPVCTPARGTLLTGKYPHSCGVPVNDIPLPAGENTIAKILAERGYYTGFIGKWHLEGGKRLPGFVPPGPRRAGFEYWAANICSHDYFHQQYFRDDPEPIKIAGYDAPGWTDLGIEFLEKARQGGKPFCLYWQPPTPHDPYIAPPGFENLYDPEKIELRKNWKAGAKQHGTKKDIAGYYAAMACLDEQIGRLLKKLDEIGRRENYHRVRHLRPRRYAGIARYIPQAQAMGGIGASAGNLPLARRSQGWPAIGRAVLACRRCSDIARI